MKYKTVWTREEDEFLRQNAPNMTVTELRKFIQASDMQIRYRCKKLGIEHLKKAYRTWTTRDLAIAQTHTAGIAAKRIGTTKSAVRNARVYAKKRA